MEEASPAKVKIPSLAQVCIVVKNDIEKVAENYWNLLGIGPWDIFTLEPPTAFNQTYRGKPASYGLRAGICQCGSCQVELIEPLYGESMYEDFLAESGEGLQHVMYLVDTIDEARNHVQLFAEQGCLLIMDGYLPDEYFAYVDTFDALKCVWEICKFPSSIPSSIPHVRIPKDPDPKSLAKIKVKAIFQVAVVVKNIAETIKNYWNLVGIGPWEICEVRPPLLHDLIYKGKPVSGGAKAAFTMAGETQIELIEQPPPGEHIYTWEGLHHLCFTVDDIKETTKTMNSEGLSTLVSEGVGDGGCAYYDTVGLLKCIWEAFQPPTTNLPTTRYP